MPRGPGRNFEDEMRQFEAEIMGASQTQVVYGAPAVISAPPSNPVISAPPSRSAAAADDDDVMATLLKYEREVKSEAKPMSALAKDIASKKAQLLADQQALSKAKSSSSMMVPSAVASTSRASSSTLVHGVKTPTSATISDETIKKAKMKKRVIRTGGGQVWEDESLKDWDPNDFRYVSTNSRNTYFSFLRKCLLSRIFCGDLGNDVTDEVLARTFGRYQSFQKAKVIRDKRTNKTKGFGFISFRDPGDFTRAMREMNGKYVGSR